MSSKLGYDSEKFVSFFMGSELARSLDSLYNRMQWAGEEYLLEELLAESGGAIQHSDETLSSEIMYWIGYIYRYWHYYRQEPSTKIYRQANYMTEKRNYLMFHTMDPELAIENLIEIKLQMAILLALLKMRILKPSEGILKNKLNFGMHSSRKLKTSGFSAVIYIKTSINNQS